MGECLRCSAVKCTLLFLLSTAAAQTPGSPAGTGAEYSRGRTMVNPGQDSEMRHVSSVESRDFHAEGVPPSPTGPDATSGPATR